MRIFIIEDDSVIREELALFLEKYGYDCESTEDFRHADAQALASGVDLILLDIGLRSRMVTRSVGAFARARRCRSLC